MKGDSLEVYCQNVGCGEPELHTDIVGHHEIMRFRQMSYMGRKEVKAVAVVAKMLLSRDTPSTGIYHLYQCPVCGAKRVFRESGGLTEEVDPGVLEEMAA